MQRQIIVTEDGSHTFYIPEMDEHFHSVHGAIQESSHIFIRNGLQRCRKKKIFIFEAGFGTGLNVLLTLMNRGDREIHYYSIEKYPLTSEEYEELNYPDLTGAGFKDIFFEMHRCEWNRQEQIIPGFSLMKIKADLLEINFSILPFFDLIYYDAFAPSKQPELWDEKIFTAIAHHTSPHGIFVTYCAKGEVRRSLTRCGFNMQRLPGPPGKKEILYGEKTN